MILHQIHQYHQFVKLKRKHNFQLNKYIRKLNQSVADYIVVVQNLQQQTSGVMDLLEPQNIAYFYSSIIYQLWSIQLQQQNVIRLSQFQDQRNLETVDSMFQDGRIYLRQLNINIPKLAKDQGINEFEVKYVANNVLDTFITRVDNFYFMLNEICEFTYRMNLNSSNQYYAELYSTGFIRLNILSVANQINNLVISIIDDTILSQNEMVLNFQKLILIQLFLKLLLIVIEYKYWMFIDKLQKYILFLVSHLNENQALEQIAKLITVKSNLDITNSYNWKIENFSQLMIENEGQKKIKLKQTECYGKPNSSESSRTSRIKKTQHINKINYFVISYLKSLKIYYYHQLMRYQLQSQKMHITTMKQVNLIVFQMIIFVNQSYGKNLRLAILQNNTFLTLGTQHLYELISKDSINNLLVNGILGYTASLVKYIEQDYNQELNTLHYNSNDENLIAIQSQSFQTYFLSYFCDIQDTFLDFLDFFKVDNSNIAQRIINLMEIYNLFIGSFDFIFMISLSSIWIYLEQKKMISLRQIIVLIPQDILQNQNMKNRIKLTFKWLYIENLIYQI